MVNGHPFHWWGGGGGGWIDEEPLATHNSYLDNSQFVLSLKVPLFLITGGLEDQYSSGRFKRSALAACSWAVDAI